MSAIAAFGADLVASIIGKATSVTSVQLRKLLTRASRACGRQSPALGWGIRIEQPCRDQDVVAGPTR